MDPVTSAIIASVSFIGIKVSEEVIKDAYQKLKELLKKKYGSKSRVIKAVKELEANPKSDARKGVVKEELAAVKAGEDQELVLAAQNLLKAVKSIPGSEQIIQTAIGDHNIQVAGDSNSIDANPFKRN